MDFVEVFQTIGHAYVWSMKNMLVINAFLAIAIVFFQRREPSTVWTWLLVLYFIPFIGFFLYLLLGQHFHKDKMFRMKEIEGELKYAANHQEESIYHRRLRLADSHMERYENQILYNLQQGECVLTDNNDVQILTDGREKFETLIQEIRQAKTYIHLQYYIIKPDELWMGIENELEKKVKEGVQVRVLYDSMGCRSMRRKDWNRIRSKGIQIAEFFPALLGKLQLRVNYRNHRKIAIIDGRVGFVGGYNIGREYIGRDERFGYWRDTHLCIEGAAVTSLAVRFTLDWNYAARENLFLQDDLFQIPIYHRYGHDPIQIVTSGPDSTSQEIRDNYLQLINHAKKRIYIQTPYFIPDDIIKNALLVALKTGVEVNIMIPCKPDHPFVYWATYSYIGEMVKEGAKCYRYDNGFLHAKTLSVDGEACCVGTANMDIRSFKLNFEVNAVVYSRKTAGFLEETFQNDIQKSTLVTRQMYEARNLWIRFKEQFSRLLSPLL